MTDFFIDLLLGHFIGNYLLQNKWMETGKSKSSWICHIHCLIYTITVYACTCHHINSYGWALLIYATHFLVDRWDLASKWLSFIHGRTFRDYFKLPKSYDQRYTSLQGSFLAVVYTFVDNTIHLSLMYWGAKLW